MLALRQEADELQTKIDRLRGETLQNMSDDECCELALELNAIIGKVHVRMFAGKSMPSSN